MKVIDFLIKRTTEFLIFIAALGYFDWPQESIQVTAIFYVTISAWVYGSTVVIRLQDTVSPVGLLFVSSLPIFLFYYVLVIDGGDVISINQPLPLMISLLACFVSNSVNLIREYRKNHIVKYNLMEKYSGITFYFQFIFLVFFLPLFNVFDVSKEITYSLIIVSLFLIDIMYYRSLDELKRFS